MTRQRCGLLPDYFGHLISDLLTVFSRADEQRFALKADDGAVPRSDVDLVRRVWSQTIHRVLGRTRPVDRQLGELAAAVVAASSRSPADVEPGHVAPVAADFPRDFDARRRQRHGGQQLNDRSAARQFVTDVDEIQRRTDRSPVGQIHS